MKRRSFISAIGGAVAIPVFASSPAKTESKRPLYPLALKPGDTVGVISPGTAVSDPDDIAMAEEALDSYELCMQLGSSVLKGSGYKTRSISERVDDIHEMFMDNSVSGIFAIRGGYGSAQLLDKLDYKMIRNHPKVFMGYSDITALHLAISRYSGLVTFHGPVMLSSFTKYSAEYMMRAVFDTIPIGRIENPDTKSGLRIKFPIRTIVPGIAKGRLTGGNLTIISTLMGTPYEIETKGKILFLEDVGEEPYSIDRMLTQLRLAGKLDEAAGIVFGICSSCDAKSNIWDYSLGEVLDRILGSLQCPAMYGFLIGHTSNQVTLPLGVEAYLDTSEELFYIRESGVI